MENNYPEKRDTTYHIDNPPEEPQISPNDSPSDLAPEKAFPHNPE
jgi:hypothetical protein